MEAREYLKKIEKDKVLSKLKKKADDNITSFTTSAMSYGAIKGFKVGFVFGLIASALFYLIVR